MSKRDIGLGSVIIRGKYFSAYLAVEGMQIDPAKPWQIINRVAGCICGKVATKERARAAVAALDEDKEAGKLPTRLNDWAKAAMLS